MESMAAGDKFRAELHQAEKANVRRTSRYEDAEKVNELSDARIMSQIGWIEDQLSKTYEVLGDLRSRIEPVLLPDRPGPSGPDMPASKMTGELSARLDGIAQQVMNLQARIAQTAERVQL